MGWSWATLLFFRFLLLHLGEKKATRRNKRPASPWHTVEASPSVQKSRWFWHEQCLWPRWGDLWQIFLARTSLVELGKVQKVKARANTSTWLQPVRDTRVLMGYLTAHCFCLPRTWINFSGSIPLELHLVNTPRISFIGCCKLIETTWQSLAARFIPQSGWIHYASAASQGQSSMWRTW